MYTPVWVMPVIVAVPGMPVWSTWLVAAAFRLAITPAMIMMIATTTKMPPVSCIAPPA